MAVASDPFESYLQRAASLFESGDIVQAGQIWQAILKKRPDHEVARAGLYKVKLYFDARATQDGLVRPKPEGDGDVRATAGALPKSVDPEITRLLEQGCTLYDAGHVEDALTKWVQVLAKEPDNVLAKGYINGAKRSMQQFPAMVDVPPVFEAAPEPAPSVASSEPEADIERLLRDGCTLFDMGQVEDALQKWNQILVQQPGHGLARAYVQDARKELGLPPLEEGEVPAVVPERAAPVVPQASQAVADDERIDSLIRDGVQLYDMGMVREAMDKWQQVLQLVPGHRDAQEYLAMAERDAKAPTAQAKPASSPAVSEMSGRDFPGLRPRTVQAPEPQAPVLQLAEPEEGSEPQTPAHPVTPPAALTTGSQKTRKGFNLTEALQGVSLPPWIASPAFILGTIAGLVVLVIGSYYYMQHRKDAALRQAVAAFRASATAPVARDAEIKNLDETPAEIREEVNSAMDANPLLAYFRAEELAKLNPGDAPTAELLEHAKQSLSKNAEGSATVTDFEKQVQAGDLDAADHTMTILLSQHPDDAVLRDRAVRLYSTLIPAHASQEHWLEAEDHIRLARAMFPEDKSWNAKLQLLKSIESMSKAERATWIQLLG
jgi:tetratricopeptide (TPR) repeat protein